MKKFFYRILFTLVFSVLLLELTCRIFQLSAHTVPEANINGNRLLLPGNDGYWIRGGLAEIKNNYKINNEGWNSIVNYTKDDFEDKTSIAIIGDSYIEGFQVDVENSIGRLLEQKSTKLKVHEYGRSGGNIADYAEIYQNGTKDIYDFTFILVTNKDLIAQKPSIINQGKKIPKIGLLRKTYDRMYFIRYLNINHGLGVKINKLTKKRMEPNIEEELKGISDIFLEEKMNQLAISKLDSNVVFLYEETRLDTSFVNQYNCQLITHNLLPKDHGFDGHWNLNGRHNCADAILSYIESAATE